MESKERKPMPEQLKKRRSLVDMMTHAYIRRIKKWMFCPACRDGKMQINRASTLWKCEECSYSLSADEYEDNYVFWFCDECETYLNNQDGFDKAASKHICRNCGYENDTTFDNIKGICSDCGKTLPDVDATLCVDCKTKRRKNATNWLIAAGVIAAGVVVAATSTSDEKSYTDEILEYPPLDDNTSDDDDEVYGLGPGIYPTCKTCGTEMTVFDGYAWYTCPFCEDKVRIIDGKETWYNEIFGCGKKQHRSDYELADFCRGGELSED